jgi:hypothetical protein
MREAARVAQQAEVAEAVVAEREAALLQRAVPRPLQTRAEAEAALVGVPAISLALPYLEASRSCRHRSAGLREANQLAAAALLAAAAVAVQRAWKTWAAEAPVQT